MDTTLAEGMGQPWEIRIFKPFERAWHQSTNDRSAVVRRIAEWVPQLRSDPFNTDTLTETWTQEGHPNVYSAHLPCEWRALFSIEQEHHLVALHILQDHQNYDSQENQQRVRGRISSGLTRRAKLLETPSIPPSASGISVPVEPSVEPWITELELEDMGIPKMWWSAILALPLDDGAPDLSEAKLPDEVITQLMTYYTEAGSSLDKIYEARLVGPENRPLVSLQLKLDPEQQAAKQALLASRSVFMLKGGPGTGKSTVLLDAAVSLARHKRPQAGEQPRLLEAPNQHPIGLLTFNWELRDRHLEDAEILAPDLKVALRVKELGKDTGLVISNLDTWVTRPMMVEELGYAPKAITGRNELDLLKAQLQKVAAIQPRHGSILQGLSKRAGEEYILDEVNLMILGWGFGNRAEYLAANRKGRKLNLQPTEREAVWTLSELYIKDLESRSPKAWTWSSGRLATLQALSSNSKLQEKYQLDLLLVDEAQDMTPVMIRLLLALVGGEHEYRRLRFASDPGQCLYGPALLWRRIHDKLNFQGKTAILKTAHRSGQALLDAAHFLRLAKDDGEEEVPKATSRRKGDKPRLVWAQAGAHLELVRKWWQEEWAGRGRSPRDAAILCRDHQQAKSVRSVLGIGPTDKNDPVRTLHQARGQGWPVVIIPFLSESAFPPENQRKGLQGTEAWQEAMEEERSLLYIGLTRASHQSILMADPEDRSQLLQRVDEGQWDVVRIPVKELEVGV